MYIASSMQNVIFMSITTNVYRTKIYTTLRGIMIIGF